MSDQKRLVNRKGKELAENTNLLRLGPEMNLRNFKKISKLAVSI